MIVSFSRFLSTFLSSRLGVLGTGGADHAGRDDDQEPGHHG
jgi:hypothetical protein